MKKEILSYLIFFLALIILVLLFNLLCVPLCKNANAWTYSGMFSVIFFHSFFVTFPTSITKSQFKFGSMKIFIIKFKNFSTNCALSFFKSIKRISKKFFMALSQMFFMCRKQFKIFYSIIIFYSVNMMNNFFRFQISSNFFLHYKSAFSNTIIVRTKRMIGLINQDISQTISFSLKICWNMTFFKLTSIHIFSLLFFTFNILCYPIISQAYTYYVKSSGGSDTNDGKSWANAWATVSKVNSTLIGGDTVFFGTGTWYNSQINPPTGASGSDRTCYACSSFVRGICKIYGGTLVTNWIQHSGNVYKAQWVGSGCYEDKRCYTLGQNDSLLEPVDAIPTSSGKFYHNTTTDTLYTWCYGGGDPDNYTMIASCKPAVYVNIPASHTTLWGIDFKYGKQGVIFLHDAKADSFFIDHCNVSRSAHKAGENASAIFFGSVPTDSADNGHWNRVRACSLGHTVEVTMAPNHMDGLCAYGESYLTVESCYVFPPIGIGINFKGQTTQPAMVGNKMRFNTVKNAYLYGLSIHSVAKDDSIYGNIIIGNSSGPDRGIELYGNNCYGGLVVYNNTIYNSLYSAIETGSEGNNTGTNYIKYNIFHTIQDGGEGIVILYGTDYQHFVIDSNWIYNSTYNFYCNGAVRTLTVWRNTYGFDVHSDTTDPKLVDPANGNFNLQATSPCINAGVDWGIGHNEIGALAYSEGDSDTYPPNDVVYVDTTSPYVTTNTVYLKCHPSDSADCANYMVRYLAGATAPLTYNSGIFGDSSTGGINDTIFEITGLSANTQYSFTVFAKDEIPNWSNKGTTSWITVTTDAQPPGKKVRRIRISYTPIPNTSPAKSNLCVDCFDGFGDSTRLGCVVLIRSKTLIQNWDLPQWKCADVNDDDNVDIGDIVQLVGYVYYGQDEPICR